MKNLASAAIDMLGCCGLVAIVVGVAMLNAAAGWIVAGAIVVTVAVLLAHYR